MITKDVLEKLLEKSVVEGSDYALNNLHNTDVDPIDYAFECGVHFGLEKAYGFLLALLDDANISSPNV